tara:strand:+ start:82 stop:318 length:237 start_codon:yes stop_codon:yes gene_type:complete
MENKDSKDSKQPKQKINKRWVEQMHARLVLDFFNKKDERIRALDATNALKEIAKLRDYYPVIKLDDNKDFPTDVKLEF